MNPIPAFAASYAEARRKFLAASAARGVAVETHEHPALKGAEGETLAIDVARLGTGRDAVLMMTSGTHGVEGFCGSGVQVALLEDDDFVRMVDGSGVSLVLVHAVNPHGFSHLRRVNEDNVDLNRNFVDFSGPLPPNDAYAEVHGFMLPATWPPPPANEARMGEYVARRGAKALQAALTSGQAQFPDGLFFSGTKPAWSNGVVRGVLRRHAAPAKRLAWIDVHTALGPWGHGEKIFAGPDDRAMLERTRAIYGADVTSFYEGSSTSAKLDGLITLATRDECPGVLWTAIGLEYGTLPLMQVLQALRGDHWLHNHPDAPAAVRTAVKQAIRGAFHGDRDDWKAMIYAQARVTCIQALRALGMTGPTVGAG